MSHFCVLVIGPDLEAQLAGYHEYECTGVDDQYVTDVDITDEVLAEFAKPHQVVRLAGGQVLGRYDNELYTKIPDDVAKVVAHLQTLETQLAADEDPDTAFSIMDDIRQATNDLQAVNQFSRNQFELPEGAVELEISADEARTHNIGYQTLAACADEYFSAKEKDGRFYRHTNVNAKWDWYQVGGRWTGFWRLKPNAAGEVGDFSLVSTRRAEPGTADVALKKDIDFAAMRNEAGEKAGALWDKAKAIAGEGWESWDSVRERLKDKIDEARNFYNSQPAIRALQAVDRKDFGWDIDDTLARPREPFVQSARDRACVPYALVRDSKWLAKGQMGWWGISRNEEDITKWNYQVNKMLDELPDDTTLSIVDAHI
jgi:hypothetical protein